MKRLAVCLLLAMLAVVPARAEISRLDTLPELTLFFPDDVRFVSGVHVEDDIPVDVWLVDTMSERGFYLEFLRDNDIRFHTSIPGIRLESDWKLEVSATDCDHCSLSVDTGTEKRLYEFGYLPNADYGAWWLERYSIQSGERSFEARIVDLWQVEMTESENGNTRYARAAWLLQNSTYSLIIEELPRSIAEAHALERKLPVAAIAPRDIQDRVNLREGPSTDFPRAGSLYSGTLVSIDGGTDGEWLYVNPLNGGTQWGYVHKSLLAFGEDIWNVPDATRTMRAVSQSGSVPVSFYPYHSNNPAGALVSGTDISIVGYYNDAWAIYGSWPGALYIETKYLRQPHWNADR